MTTRYSRRTLLRRVAGIGSGAIVASAAPGLLVPAHAAEKPKPKKPEIQRKKRRPNSLNGWETADKVDAGQEVWSRPVPGTGFELHTRIGAVETVLVHVVRRWHYEIEALRKGEVVGWQPLRELDAKRPESNLASGTAVAIRPESYVPGAKGGLLKWQLDIVRSILDDCGGLVRWGGDDEKPYEALFYIDVPPSRDARGVATGALERLEKKLRGWNHAPGKGAGAAA